MSEDQELRHKIITYFKFHPVPDNFSRIGCSLLSDNEIAGVIKKLTRECKGCGQKFIALASGQLFCTKQCWKETYKSNYWQVLVRDGFRCQYCGRTPSEDNVKLEVDHIKPKSDGGRETLGNKVTACQECNRHKNRSPLLCEAEFKRRIQRSTQNAIALKSDS